MATFGVGCASAIVEAAGGPGTQAGGDGELRSREEFGRRRDSFRPISITAPA